MPERQSVTFMLLISSPDSDSCYLVLPLKNFITGDPYERKIAKRRQKRFFPFQGVRQRGLVGPHFPHLLGHGRGVGREGDVGQSQRI